MTAEKFMRLALRLAKKGFGATSPNPMVGAVLVRGGRVIGKGWHRGAGLPHAEIEAIRNAERRGNNPRGATLYVTLEPCSTHGRTPPCTEAIIAAGIRKVVIGATDPNPKHAGRAFGILKRAGVQVVHGILEEEVAQLNEPFNHWVLDRTPFVTVKAAMTLDGKIATARGESKWITGPKARAHGMKLRQGADAVLVGINTILADDPELTVRLPKNAKGNIEHRTSNIEHRIPRRIVLDSLARTPVKANVVGDEFANHTTIVVTKRAPKERVAALAKRVNVWVAPESKIKNQNSKMDLRWLLKKLGKEDVTSLLVEGGGEVNASFLFGGLAHRVAFFYAPKILGGRDARKGVAGEGVQRVADMIKLSNVDWKWLGPDLLLTARVK